MFDFYITRPIHIHYTLVYLNEKAISHLQTDSLINVIIKDIMINVIAMRCVWQSLTTSVFTCSHNSNFPRLSIYRFK